MCLTEEIFLFTYIFLVMINNLQINFHVCINFLCVLSMLRHEVTSPDTLEKRERYSMTGSKQTAYWFM